jgi:hypothetical protein
MTLTYDLFWWFRSPYSYLVTPHTRVATGPCCGTSEGERVSGARQRHDALARRLRRIVGHRRLGALQVLRKPFTI